MIWDIGGSINDGAIFFIDAAAENFCEQVPCISFFPLKGITGIDLLFGPLFFLLYFN